MKSVFVDIVFTLARMYSALPLRLHHAKATVISFVLGKVLKYRRPVIEANLKAAFPDMEPKDRYTVTEQYYRNISDLITEFIWAIGKSGEKLEKTGFVTVYGRDCVLNVYDRNKGVMILHSHSGNWEMMMSAIDLIDNGGLFGKKDIRTTYRRLKNGFWEKFILKARAYGKAGEDQCIESDNVLRYMLRHKNEGLIYHFLVDQYPYHSPYPIGEFLGLPTNAMMAPANLAERFSMPVVYCSTVRTSRGKYDLSFTKICDNASETGSEEVMKRYFSLLENDIRQHPANWLWSHKRWKNIQGMYPPRKKKKTK